MAYRPPVSVKPLIKFARWTALSLGIGYGVFRHAHLKEYESRVREVYAKHKIILDKKRKLIMDKQSRADMEYLGKESGVTNPPDFDERYPLVTDADIQAVCAEEAAFFKEHENVEGPVPLEEQFETLREPCQSAEERENTGEHHGHKKKAKKVERRAEEEENEEDGDDLPCECEAIILKVMPGGCMEDLVDDDECIKVMPTTKGVEKTKEKQSES